MFTIKKQQIYCQAEINERNKVEESQSSALSQIVKTLYDIYKTQPKQWALKQKQYSESPILILTSDKKRNTPSQKIQ